MTQNWDPRNVQPPQGGGYPAPMPQQGYPQPGYPPQGYAPAPVSAPAEMPDMTEEGSLNDDVVFEALASLPDQGVNESIRFCFLIFDAEGDIRFRAGSMFYGRIGEKRFPFLSPPDTHPLFARCVDKWNMPKKRLGSIVLAYNTDKEGNFIPSDTFKYRLHVLHYNDVQAKWFRTQNKRRAFRTHDLMRTATKATQFGVEYGYSIEDQCVFGTLPEDKQAEILEKAMVLHQRYLGPTIGRPRPDHEIEDLLRDIDPTQRRQGAGGPSQVNPWAASPSGFQGYGQPQLAQNAYAPPHQQLPPPGGYSPPAFHGQGAAGQHGQYAPQPTSAADFSQRMAAASHQMPGQPPAESPPPAE